MESACGKDLQENEDHLGALLEQEPQGLQDLLEIQDLKENPGFRAHLQTLAVLVALETQVPRANEDLLEI